MKKQQPLRLLFSSTKLLCLASPFDRTFANIEMCGRPGNTGLFRLPPSADFFGIDFHFPPQFFPFFQIGRAHV